MRPPLSRTRRRAAAVLAVLLAALPALAQTDTTAPSLSRAEVDGKTLTLFYNEALNAASQPLESDFTVTIAAGTGLTPTTASQNPTRAHVSGSEVGMILGTPVMSGQTVTVTYTKGTNPVEDAAGNDAANLTNQSVTNNTALVSNLGLVGNNSGTAAFDVAQHFTTGGRATRLSGVELEMGKFAGWATVPHAVRIHAAEASGRPGASLGTLTNPTTDVPEQVLEARRFSAPSSPAIVLDGGTRYWVVLDYEFTTAADAQRNLISLLRSNEEDAGATTGWSIGNDRLSRNSTVTTGWSEIGLTNSLAMSVHGTPVAPTLAKATVSGPTMVLTFNATLATTATPAAAFTVTAGGTGQTPTNVQVSGSEVTLTLGTAVTSGQTVTVSYNKANAGTAPLRDTGATPLEVATFSAQSVTNNTLAAPVFTGQPTTATVQENSLGGTAVVTVAATPVAGVTLSYSLDATSAAVFDISSAGAITVKAGAALDHEATPSYTTVVTADNGGSTSTHTVTISVTDVNEPPPTPGAPTVSSAGPTSLSVSWTAPDVSGRPPIRSYSVRYRQQGTGAWMGPVLVTTASATISSLTESTTYQVQVQASNVDGVSGWSASGSGTTGSATIVPRTSALIPPGLGDGDRFRVLAITKLGPFQNLAHQATFKNIDDVNALVSEGVAGGAELAPYKNDFRVVASTTGDSTAMPPIPAVAARDNTYTTGTGVPIWWFRGGKVADDYPDFYDGGWDTNQARYHDGHLLGANFTSCAITGTAADGTLGTRPIGSTDFVGRGCAHTQGNELFHDVWNMPDPGDAGLYALSPVFEVDGTPPAKVVSTAGQSPDGTGFFTHDVAQKFTTGNNAAGYSLARVDVNMSTSAATPPVYSVAVWDGLPGDEGSSNLGTLTNPVPLAQFHQPPNSFTAPAGGISLDANTDYWLVIDISTGDGATSIRFTSSDSEDTGAATGWSVEDTNRHRANTATTWDFTGTTTLMFAIYADSKKIPAVTITRGSPVTEGGAASFTLTASETQSAELTVNLTVTEAAGSDYVAESDKGPKTVTFRSGAMTASYSVPTQPDNADEPNGSVTVTVAAGTGYTVGTPSSASVTVNDDDGGGGGGVVIPPPPPPPPPGDNPDSATQPRPEAEPLQLALWTERPGYRPGDTVRLHYSLDPHDDRGRYRVFAYLERAGGGRRRWLAPLSAGDSLHDRAVDLRGVPASAAEPRILYAVDRELAFEGPAPGPGLWQFVLELRPGSPEEQPEQPAEPLRTRQAWAKFAVGERSRLLNVRGFDREVRGDLTLRGDTVYYLQHQLFVHDGATLAIEPGTVVQAWGRQAAIIVLPGGKLVAEGTRQAPVVLTCSEPAGQRRPGCWGGLRILGKAPVTRLEGTAPGVLPAERAAYGGSEAEGSSAALRYVRVEFAGASADPESPAAAVGLYGAGSGTVLDHVQARASLGDGFAFHGGAASCDYCVASGSGAAGLSWQRGWRGGASHLYVQHGRGGRDGLAGGHDGQGHDLQPRSLPTLSNVTLVHAVPYGRHERRAVAVLLSDGSAVQAVDLLAVRFGGGALRAKGRSRLLFGEGESSVGSALLYLNGAPQVPSFLAEAVEFSARDPKLRDVRDFANPDPRPKAGSPALPDDREGYIGAFDREENWLEEWTVFGPESVYDLRNKEDGP